MGGALIAALLAGALLAGAPLAGCAVRPPDAARAGGARQGSPADPANPADSLNSADSTDPANSADSADSAGSAGAAESGGAGAGANGAGGTGVAGNAGDSDTGAGDGSTGAGGAVGTGSAAEGGGANAAAADGAVPAGGATNASNAADATDSGAAGLAGAPGGGSAGGSGAGAGGEAGAGDAAADGSGAGRQPEYRLVATSRAAVEICASLGLELAGRPALDGLPEQYTSAALTGSAMAPDLEAIKLLDPTEVVGPDTLEADISPGYENAGIPATFLNLRSVAGLYESVEYLGEKYGKAERARELVGEYQKTLAGLESAKAGAQGPRVLVLMGLPGAYIECTASSYAGSLVEMGGAANVVEDATEDFVSWNTESLLALDPDIILRTAHAMPEQVADMFAKEFAENDIWKHFRAVQEGRVYDLDYTVFGMSANFRWPEAIDTMEDIFYGAPE
jgi:iron complex transport system substrate-binding protein